MTGASSRQAGRQAGSAGPASKGPGARWAGRPGAPSRGAAGRLGACTTRLCTGGEGLGSLQQRSAHCRERSRSKEQRARAGGASDGFSKQGEDSQCLVESSSGVMAVPTGLVGSPTTCFFLRAAPMHQQCRSRLATRACLEILCVMQLSTGHHPRTRAGLVLASSSTSAALPRVRSPGMPQGLNT